jgi:hypothetical protein
MKKILLFVWAALCIYSSNAQPTAGLVAYWPMNGNFNDAGPNAINGSNIGATASTNNAGLANTAMAFANPTATVAQYATHPVNAALNFLGTQNFSISFAFYVNTPFVHNMGLYDNCINYGGPGIFFWQPGASPNVQFNYKNLSLASTPLTTGSWYYITCLRNNGTLQIYINGVLNSSGPEGTLVPVYSYPARIGTMFFNGQTPPQYNPLHGKLDEMRIYNRALLPAEITTLYNLWAAGILPVKINSFTATKNNADVLLYWQTDNEVNSSHFNIQRSTDGINFTDIAKLNAVGNTGNITNYQYTDNTVKNLLSKNIYYRLEQVDKDGRKKLGDIVLVKYTAGTSLLSLLQNPVTDALKLHINMPAKETVSLVVTNAAGQQVIVKNLPLNPGDNFTSIPVQQLAKSMYTITVVTATGKQSLLFVK